jgi:hypothetical protein
VLHLGEVVPGALESNIGGELSDDELDHRTIIAPSRPGPRGAAASFDIWCDRYTVRWHVRADRDSTEPHLVFACSSYSSRGQ